MRYLILALSVFCSLISCQKQETPKPSGITNDTTDILDTVPLPPRYFKLGFFNVGGEGWAGIPVKVYSDPSKYYLGENPLEKRYTDNHGYLRFGGDSLSQRYYFWIENVNLNPLDRVVKYDFDGQGDTINNSINLSWKPVLLQVKKQNIGGNPIPILDLFPESILPSANILGSYSILDFDGIYPNNEAVVHRITDLYCVEDIDSEFETLTTTFSFVREPIVSYFNIWDLNYDSLGLVNEIRFTAEDIQWGNDIYLRTIDNESANGYAEHQSLFFNHCGQKDQNVQRQFDQNPNPFLLINRKILELINLKGFDCNLQMVSFRNFTLPVPFHMGANNLISEDNELNGQTVEGSHIYQDNGYPSESHYVIRDSTGSIIEDFILIYEYDE